MIKAINIFGFNKFLDFNKFRLKQLIKVPTRTTTNSSTIIDHILASYPERVTQCRVKYISLSHDQLIYCTRKISRIKRGSCDETACDIHSQPYTNYSVFFI